MHLRASVLGYVVALAATLAACSGTTSQNVEHVTAPTAASPLSTAVIAEDPPTQPTPTAVPSPLTTATSEPGRTTALETTPGLSSTRPDRAIERPGPPIACTPAPTDMVSVWMAPIWQVGDIRELIQYKQRIDSRSPEVVGFSETPIRLQVLAADDATVTFEWRPEVTDLSSLIQTPLAAALIGDLLDDLPPQPIVYRIGPTVQLEAVENIHELRSYTADLYQALGKALPGLEGAAEMVLDLPDETLGQLLAKDVLTIHGLEGLEIGVNDAIMIDDELPNPFGGDALAAKTRIDLTDLVDSDGCVQARMVTELDAETALPALLNALATLTGDDDVDNAELAAVAASFSIVNTVVGQWDAGSGLFRTIVATQSINDGLIQRVDTRIIIDITDG